MSLAKYILNLEEFSKLYEDIALNLGEADLSKLEALLRENLSAIIELLRRLMGNKGYGCVDMSKHIPAIEHTFIICKSFLCDILLTGITFSQSAWKTEDTISLMVGEICVIDEIHTKELGQEKIFFSAFFVAEGEEVKVVYNNKSGNSKMFFCDLDYIKLEREEK